MDVAHYLKTLRNFMTRPVPDASTHVRTAARRRARNMVRHCATAVLYVRALLTPSPRHSRLPAPTAARSLRVSWRRNRGLKLEWYSRSHPRLWRGSASLWRLGTAIPPDDVRRGVRGRKGAVHAVAADLLARIFALGSTSRHCACSRCHVLARLSRPVWLRCRACRRPSVPAVGQ